MKICLFTDVHWSKKASLVTSYGTKYSTRLEHLINSMNWVNELAVKETCTEMICAGDFMDKSYICDEEITALNEIKWSNLKCYFLCGNHESSVNDLRFSSVSAVESSLHRVISSCEDTSIIYGTTQIHFLPYVVECDKRALSEYIVKDPSCNKHVIISHNDIAGIRYGNFESTLGFSIKEIEDNCDLFLNGHLHNQSWITNKILNLGSLLAHNFTNDSSEYLYGAWILDTDTLQMKFYENPYSFNFYKLEIKANEDIRKLDSIKQNSVLTIKCEESLRNTLLDKIDSIKTKIVETRINYSASNESDDIIDEVEEFSMDHLSELSKFAISKLGDSKILSEELGIICG